MTGYLLPLACPTCAGPLVHVTASKVAAGTECCAVARCEPCRMEFSVHVQLRPMPRHSRFAA